MKSPVVILGAGLTGLSTAYYLKTDYHIFEKEDEAGGLCRSHLVDGFTFDYTGHLLFLKNPVIKKLVSGLLGDNLIKHRRNSFVYLKNRFIPYPFQANFGLLPASLAKECLGDFISSWGNRDKKRSRNLEEWMKNTFGNGLNKYFFEPYNRKMWNVPLSLITLDWVEKFIPRPTLDEVIDGALEDRKKKYGYNVEFWYPKKGGIFSLPLALKKKVKNLHLKEEVTGIFLKKKIVCLKSKNEAGYSKIVSALPLPELLKIIKDLPSEVKSAGEELSCCSVYNINLGIERKVYPDIHWVYLPERKYPFYRFGISSNFSEYTAPSGKTSIYVEISYLANKPIDKNKVFKDTVKRLKELKVISKESEINVLTTLDIKYAYVVYDFARKKYLRSILDYLKNHGIYSIGRYGAWEYSSMNDAITYGINTAGELNAAE